MLEARVTELLATHLSRFFENVNPSQLQLSLWSGNLVLSNVKLRKDILERMSALLHGENMRVDGDADDPRSFPLGTAATPGSVPESVQDGSSVPASSMHMLLAPLTVVRGDIEQLVITVPWASLESKPVQVQVIGVNLVLAPLRARPFDAREEQEREEAMKQLQLRRYEKERQSLAREAADQAESCGSRLWFSGARAGSSTENIEGSGGTQLGLGASWFRWLWDFDRMSQIALRNASVTVHNIAMCYEFDYEGLHSSCASAFCVFVKEMKLTTTNEDFEDVVNVDLLSPLCKRIVLSEVVVSTHAIRQCDGDVSCSAEEGVGGQTSAAASEPADLPPGINLSETARTRASAGLASLGTCTTGYNAYALRWTLSTAILRLKTVEVLGKMTPPRCAAGSTLKNSVWIPSAGNIELTVAAMNSIDVNWCFGAVQVLESMWRSYHQSLSCAKYRRRLHLLRPIRGQTTQHLAQGQAPSAVSGEVLQCVSSVLRPTARQRWSFVLWCTLDDIRQNWHTCGVYDRNHCNVVETMMRFGHMRKCYIEYWKRASGAVWAPPLNALETTKMERMERQLSLWQLIFLRCLANAELKVEQDRYAQQQALIEDARQLSTKAALSCRQTTDVNGSYGAVQFLWRWLFTSVEPTETINAVFFSGKPHTLSTTGPPMDLEAPPAHESPHLCDLVALEWEIGRRFTSSYRAPLTKPCAPNNRLRDLAKQNKLYFTLHVDIDHLVLRLVPRYWPLIHDSSVPATPGDTPLQRVGQELVAHVHALELFYTTTPDTRADAASLYLFLRSASITFEGVLRSVLLQSKERVGEDYVTLSRNAQCTHLSIGVAPQVVICQPTHEWAWWFVELSAFARWARAVQKRFYESAIAEASPCLFAPAKRLRGDTHSGTLHDDDESTQRCSLVSTPSCQQLPSAMGGTSLSVAPLVPLTVSVTLQSLDVCVPLFGHDMEGSAFQIVNHDPSPSSPTVLETFSPETTPQASCSRGVRRNWRCFPERESNVDKANSRQNKCGLSAVKISFADSCSTKSVIPSLADMRKADGWESPQSSISCPSAVVPPSVGSAPGRSFLPHEPCLVLSVSTTQLFTCASSPTTGHVGSVREYKLSIGDRNKAVRLFCQGSQNAPETSCCRQLEVLSFAMAEVRWNPKQLVVSLRNGIDAVADPAVLALVNDALLKPSVFSAADADGDSVRALVADLQKSERSWVNGQRSAAPWRFITSTRVELSNEGDAPPVLREVPVGLARDVIWSALASPPVTIFAPPVADASSHLKFGINIFGGRVAILRIDLARFCIRSGANTDVAEAVCVAPEQWSPAAASYRKALGALGTDYPSAIEIIYSFDDSRWLLEEEGTDEKRSRGASESRSPRSFYLFIPEVTMTTTAGRKLLTLENFTIVRSCTARATPELVLSIQKCFALCDVVFVQVLEVISVTNCSLRCVPYFPQVATRDVAGDPRSGARKTQGWRSLLETILPIRVRVQTAEYRIPMSNDSTEMPFVEVVARVENVHCDVDPWEDASGWSGQQGHLHVTVSEVVQLVDYTGGDPEVRYLVSPCSWASRSVDVRALPLQCSVDIIHRESLNTGVHTSVPCPSNAPSPITCRLALKGGVFHVYCPLVYFCAESLKRDARLVRLAELTRSPLLARGYTNVSISTDRTLETTFGGSGWVSPTAARMSSLSLEATASDAHVLLASNAAVPIEVTDKHSFAVIHVERVMCGLQERTSQSLSRTAPSDIRTSILVEITGVQMRDPFLASPQRVGLPNVTIRADRGVLCVPKQDLTGYTNECGTFNDWSLIVDVHPAPAPTTQSAASASGVASGTESPSFHFTIEMSVDQLKILASFLMSNVAQGPIPWTRHSSMDSGGCLRQPGNGQKKTVSGRGANDIPSCVHHTRARSAFRQAPQSSAMTLLLTIPGFSVVVSAEDTACLKESACQSAASRAASEDKGKSSVPEVLPPRSPRRVRYELSLRGGAQWYWAAGGRWSAAPVSNGRVSGVELVAGEELLGSSTEIPHTSWRECTHLLLKIGLGAVAVLQERRQGSPTGPAVDASDEVVTPRVTAAVMCLRVYVQHIKWWSQLFAMFLDAPRNSSMRYSFAERRSCLSNKSLSGHDSEREQSSSVFSMVCETRRDAYMDGENSTLRARRVGEFPSDYYCTRYLHGSVAISDTEVCFLSLDSDQAYQQPRCRLIVSEAKLVMSPRVAEAESQPESLRGMERSIGELDLKILSCPKLLLWQTSETAVDSPGLQPQCSRMSGYMPVLRQHPWHTTPPTSSLLSSASDKTFFTAHVHLFEDSCLHSLQYGRRYGAGSLKLNRKSAVHVQLQNVLLEAPIAPLCLLAHQLLQQMEEAQSFVRRYQPPQSFQSIGGGVMPAAHTYVEIEVVVKESEVQLSAQGTLGGDPKGKGVFSGRPISWNVAVATARWTTGVELRNVYTSTRHAARLIYGGVGAWWRIQAWHIKPKLVLQGLVLATTRGVKVRWALPDLQMTASLPLRSGIFCVRSMGAEDEQGRTCATDNPASQSIHSTVNCHLQVEPIPATVLQQLNCHTVASFHVELDPPDVDHTSHVCEKETPVQICLHTVFVLASAAVQLLGVWSEMRPLSEAGVPPALNAHITSSKADECCEVVRELDPFITWYTLTLSLSGRSVDIVSEAAPQPVSVAASQGLRKDCGMRITLANAVVVHMESIVGRKKGKQATLLSTAQCDTLEDEEDDGKDKWAWCVDDEWGEDTELVTVFRLRTGPLHLYNGTENLVLQIRNADGKGRRNALVATYVPSQAQLDMKMSQAVVRASSSGSVALLGWYRAYCTWAPRWASVAVFAKNLTSLFRERCRPGFHGCYQNGPQLPPFQHLTFLVQQTDLVFESTARLSVQNVRVAFSTVDDEVRSVAALALEVRCDEACVHSLLPLPVVGSKTDPVVLARVLLPVLLLRNLKQPSFSLQLQTALVSIMNVDGHRWALCALTVAKVVSAALVADGGSSFFKRSTNGVLPAWMASISHADITFEKVELLCFGRCFTRSCSVAPVVSLVVRDAGVGFGACAGVVHASNADALVDKALQVSGVFSATYTTSDPSREQVQSLVDDVRLSTVLLFPLQSQPGLVEVNLTTESATENPFMSVWVPTGDTLTNVVTAVSLVARQRVPHRYVQSCPPKATSYWVESGTVTQWHVQGSFPSLQLHCVSREETDSSLLPTVWYPCSIGFRDINIQLLTTGGGDNDCSRRGYLQVSLRCVEGETVLSNDSGALDNSPTQMPSVFFAVRPLIEPNEESPCGIKTSMAGNEHPCQSNKSGFYLLHQSVSLSEGGRGCSESIPQTPSISAVAFTVRLHTLYARFSMSLLKFLMSLVVRPGVGGICAASASLSRTDILDGFEKTVLCVTHADSTLYPSSIKHRYGGQLQVIEVMQDWCLHGNLRLGGEDGLQLYFRNSAGRSVITVRGGRVGSGDGDSQQDALTLFLSLPVNANGEFCPAIRVDPDLTVRFENINIVVAEKGVNVSTSDAWVTETYVELGERSLCLLPPPAVDSTALPVAAAGTGAQPKGVAAKGLSCGFCDTPKKKSASRMPILVPPAVSPISSFDIRIGFDLSLSSGARYVAATGSVQAQCHPEGSNSSDRTLRSGRDGECIVALHTCLSEEGSLTATPLSVKAQLGYVTEENLFRVVVDCGSTQWKLPLGHAYLLIELARLTQHTLKQMDTSSPEPRPWKPPVRGPASERRCGSQDTLLSVSVEVPSWALTLTNDTGEALAMLLIERACAHCSTDIGGADFTVSAEGAISLRDCIEIDDVSCSYLGAPLCSASMGLGSASAAASRVLFSACPHLSLSFAQLRHHSRSLSVSIHVNDVLVTLPLATAARLVRASAPKTNISVLRFLNDSGVDVEAVEFTSSETTPQKKTLRWRLDRVPDRLIQTNIPLSCSTLALTPVTNSIKSVTPTVSPAVENSSETVLVNIGALVDGAVCRVPLPGYNSALGALDIVVRKSFYDQQEVVHLTTSVRLANVFFAAPASCEDLSSAETRIVSLTGDRIRLDVQPRSARYVPLPILRDTLALELDGRAYQPVAKILTWATMADAISALADHAASTCMRSNGESLKSDTAPGFMVYSNSVLYPCDDNHDEDGSTEVLRVSALSDRVRVLDGCTITFPLLLSSPADSSTTALGEESVAGCDESQEHNHPPTALYRNHSPRIQNVVGARRVVQFTWRRHYSPQTRELFTGKFPTSEFTVSVEPVWTLWNRTGCRLRLEMRFGDKAVDRLSVRTPQAATALQPERYNSASLATAEVESNGCFQWTPASLDVLKCTVLVFVELMSPSLKPDPNTSPDLHSPAQWWTVVEPLSLKEPPPLYMRLQQGKSVKRGAVRIETHGPSNVVMRCAALLFSGLAKPVYLRDPVRRNPLLGTGIKGRVLPQQQLPLFFECSSTSDSHVDGVGFTVSARPITGAGSKSESVQESDPFHFTTPVVATVLSANKQVDCTHFYTVSALDNKRLERPVYRQCWEKIPMAETQVARRLGLPCLWAPKPITVLQLRSLCRIRNTNMHRALLVMPFDTSTSNNAEGVMLTWSNVTLIPPGEEREVTEFGPHAKEPEVEFCYTRRGSYAPAHSWSPPVKLLSLATATQPLVLKHDCIVPGIPGAESEAETDERCFSMFPMYCRRGEEEVSMFDHCRCLTVQSSREKSSLAVSVGLQGVPPLKLVNRLNITLEFFQSGLTKKSDLASPTGCSFLSTTLSSRVGRPRSYMVTAESTSFGCWEVPVVEAPALRITLHSKIRKGTTVSHDVDLLRYASLPASGARIGNTDAYVHVSFDHRLRQYTVTVAPSRRLGCRMLVQPRRLTQMEVYVRSCTLYVGAITLPRTGAMARKSIIAHGMRGRMRLRRSARSILDGTRCDTVPLDATNDDLFTFLQEQEIDLVLLRLLGFYATATSTERHVIGSASLGLLEVVNCTTVEAVHPVLLRVGPRDSSGSSPALVSAEVEAEMSNTATSPSGTLEGSTTRMLSERVPHFKDPSWLAVEVQLILSEHAAPAGNVVVIPVQSLQVAVPPITMRADDDFLFTMRTAFERIGEEWALTSAYVCGSRSTHSRDLVAPTRSASEADSLKHSPCCMYNIFVYVLRISSVEAEVSYTRCGHPQYSPFKGLGLLPQELIPSFDGLSVSLNEVRLMEVELPSNDSLLDIAKSFFWPLYRTQLLLQSYKLIGSLDLLGNPRALLGGWSHGVWDLVMNSSDQNRWSRARKFLQATTSSALHSVGVLARSIGNLSGSSPQEISSRGLHSGSASFLCEGGTFFIPQPRGVIGEFFQEVGGGISDAVQTPISGARKRGVVGFFSGVAAGVASLAGRPVFGFFRGISATSEFYAQLLGGLGELTGGEARELGLRRNYRLRFTSVSDTQALKSAGIVVLPPCSDFTVPLDLSFSCGPLRINSTILSKRVFDRVLYDIPEWRYGGQASLRIALERVGLHNIALHAPHAALYAFLSPGELHVAMPYLLTGVLMGAFMESLSQNCHVVDIREVAHDKKRNYEDQKKRTLMEHECKRALHIKASLGFEALQRHVTDEVLVRVCSLAEVEACWTEKGEHKLYSAGLARAMSAAAKQLLAP